MRAICVDDERLIADYVAALCRSLPPLTEAESFTRARDALAWLEDHPAELALLDIDMPDMNGLALAAEIKRRQPDMAIVFLTGYSEYAVKAYEMHASGYLMKPVSRERLAAEVAHAVSARPAAAAAPARIAARTFGAFELLVEGKPVVFRQAKCKELLAYLVDRQGGSVTRAEAFAVLWEDRMYDRPMQKQLDAVLRSLRDTLTEQGIGEILEIRRGTLRVRPELLDCDAWRFFSGDPEAVRSYRGVYMAGYAWGTDTGSFMSRKRGAELQTEQEYSRT